MYPIVKLITTSDDHCTYLWMVGVFLLELLGVVERRLLAVLHDAQLLRRPRLPQTDVHLVRARQDVSEHRKYRLIS